MVHSGHIMKLIKLDLNVKNKTEIHRFAHRMIHFGEDCWNHFLDVKGIVINRKKSH